MLRTAFLTMLTLAIAIGGGAGSVWKAIESNFAVGTITIGNWTAVPDYGTPNADPYSKARFAREADLALGIGEGIGFTAWRDSAGDELSMRCDYLIEGAFPSARFWTLHARDARNAVIAHANGRPAALHSLALLRGPGGSAAITVSARPNPGNWLRLAGEGPFHLVLTLYDTAIASSARIAEVELPQIVRTVCHD